MLLRQFAIPKGAFALPLEEELGAQRSASAPYVDSRISGWWKVNQGPSEIPDETGGDITTVELPKAA